MGSAETSFFDNTHPWQNVTNRGISGIRNLRTKLGDLQMNMIRVTLPDIIKDMRNKKMYAERELEAMGEVNYNPAYRLQHFRNHMHVFLTHLNASLFGSQFKGSGMPASARLHNEASEFQADISNGRLANVSKFSIDSEVLILQNDGKEAAGTVLSVSAEKGGHTLFRVKKERDENEDEYYVSRIRCDPKWLIELIAPKRTRTLPCFLNEEVFRAVTKEMMDGDYIPHCRRLLARFSSILNDAITSSMKASGLPPRYWRLGQMVLE